MDITITNPDVSRYIKSFYKPVNPFLAQLRQTAEAEGVPVITCDAETLLLSLIRLRQPQRILEIGTAIGYSAICFASVSRDIHITTLEIREKSAIRARNNMEAAGVAGQIHVFCGDARELLPAMAEPQANEGCSVNEDGKVGQEQTVQAPFDMIFMDAGKGHYQAFWDGCLPLLAEDGCIICDNVLFRAMTVSDDYLDTRRNKTIARRMREFLAAVMDREDMDTSLLPVGDGMTVSVKRKHK